MNLRGVLIFSGYNHRAIVAFCRFCRENKILFFIIASGPTDFILISDYKKNVVETRNTVAISIDNVIEIKKKITNDYEIIELLILPSSEYLNRFLLQHRTELELNDFIIPLCSIELYQQLSDKYSFSELCKRHNIAVPEEYESLATINIPFVAKPKRYFSGRKTVSDKPIIVTNDREYTMLKKTNLDDFYFQEFISGQSFYLLFYFSSGGTYSVFSQENLIQQYNGLSIIAAKSSNIHLHKIATDFASLLCSLTFVGLIMIEVKFFNDRFYMIEANPRLWGPSQLILDAGMDLFDRFAAENGLIKEIPTRSYTVGYRYFWSGGIIEDQEKKYSITLHNYDKQSFFDDYAEWCKSDIYLRPDTTSIFFKELTG